MLAEAIGPADRLIGCVKRTIAASLVLPLP
jgi:hypothetical protein